MQLTTHKLLCFQVMRIHVLTMAPDSSDAMPVKRRPDSSILQSLKKYYTLRWNERYTHHCALGKRESTRWCWRLTVVIRCLWKHALRSGNSSTLFPLFRSGRYVVLCSFFHFNQMKQLSCCITECFFHQFGFLIKLPSRGWLKEHKIFSFDITRVKPHNYKIADKCVHITYSSSSINMYARCVYIQGFIAV